MKYLTERKRKKLLAELKSRRHAEDDLYSPAQRQAFDALITDLAAAPDAESAVKEAESRYRTLSLPMKRGAIYAFLDLILVVGAVAFGLRGLYFQPFRIPTSSMQPTLYGVHYRTPGDMALLKLPSPLRALFYAAAEAKAETKTAGRFEYGNIAQKNGMIFDHTDFLIGSTCYTLPGNPVQVAGYAKLEDGREFAAGETVADGFVTLGDHLFVERFSIYLSPPKRGDVMVFTTEGLSVENIQLKDQSGYYYVKRLAALPGDTVKIAENQLWVKPSGTAEFRRIQEIEPRFRKIYSGKGGYQGHLGNMGYTPFAHGAEYTLPEDYFLMLGDNSKFSMDSRFFGAVPRANLIGRAWLVFYPLSRRMGLVDSKEPLDLPTGSANISTYPVMYRQ